MHTGFEIIKSIFNNTRIRFLTLTLSPEAEQENIMKYWANFRAGLKNIGIKNYCYFWVKEFTQKGIRHLHVAISAYIDKDIIDRIWYRVTKNTSYITYITEANDVRNVAGYMTKYMTKDFSNDQYLPRERRYGFSQLKLGGINPFKKQVWKPANPVKFVFDPGVESFHKNKKIPISIKKYFSIAYKKKDINSKDS